MDHSDKYGTTPLIWAARAGHTSIVEELLTSGAQVNSVYNENQNTTQNQRRLLYETVVYCVYLT